jgi:hypothetical protein
MSPRPKQRLKKSRIVPHDIPERRATVVDITFVKAPWEE